MEAYKRWFECRPHSSRLRTCQARQHNSSLDTALLAAVACLANIKLPSVTVNEQGTVVSSTKPEEATSLRKLHLRSLPFSVTCGTFNNTLVVDPTSEEEALLQATISTIVDGQGKLISGTLLVKTWQHFAKHCLMPALAAFGHAASHACTTSRRYCKRRDEYLCSCVTHCCKILRTTPKHLHIMQSSASHVLQ